MSVQGDSYCGIYCGACSVSSYGQTGRGDGFVDCCRSVPKDELACKGCKSDSLYPGCSVCTIRHCAIAKGVAHCFDCAEYPCGMYRRWQSAAKVLRHVGEAPASLETIRAKGVEAWLAEQERRWSCPKCGAKFSWYAAQCNGCGRTLEVEAYQLSGLRKIICRWLLPMAYRKGRGKARK